MEAAWIDVSSPKNFGLGKLFGGHVYDISYPKFMEVPILIQKNRLVK